MTVFGVLPGPMDGVKIAVDKLIEYQERDDIEVRRSESDGSGKTYELTPRSEEARELLEEETYADTESELTPENPVPTDNGGDNEMTKEAPQYVEETYDMLDDLEDAVARTDTATAERRAKEVRDHVYGLIDDLDDVQDAFQDYDESMRGHLDNWTERLDEYQQELDQNTRQAHNAARMLMDTERTLLDYSLDERTEELMGVAEEL